ncbi:microsomal glutathione S-transferase 1-like isoform X1 [Haliotis rubra]|uniref:microsomal glutathione S-transferase 1-like isoform X1 n=1 Tax=Haliotis rubra TaxID=36100 RepID=UPI001EE5B3FE|nr:microsomal glutathione S-transferase 1-like isoform X1 [Haliotis rubra]
MAGVFDNPVFPYFAFYATVVVLKTMAMSFVTAFHRITKKVAINPEDIVDKDKGKISTHESVERVRRCHLNDLENVIPFVLIGLLYTASGPSLGYALLHFRIFTGARIFHTIAYLFALPQPSRGLGFFVGFLATVSMAYNVLSSATF